MGETVFGRFECACMTVNLVCAKFMFSSPRLFFAASRAAVPTVCADITLTGLFLLFVLRLMPDEPQDIMGLCEKYIGRGAGKAAALFGAALMFFRLITQSREFSAVLSFEASDALPREFAAAVLFLTASVVAFMGIEAASRLHALFVPLCAAAFAVIAAMAAPGADVFRLFPLFGGGAAAVSHDAMRALDCFCDAYVVFLLMPHIRRRGLLGRSMGAAFIVFSAAAAAVTLISAAKNGGADVPVLYLSQTANVFGHAPRLDVYLLTAQSIAALLYTACTLLFFVMCLSRALGLSDCRPLVAPSAVFFFACTLLSDGCALIRFADSAAWAVCEAVCFVISPIMLYVAVLRKRRPKKT